MPWRDSEGDDKAKELPSDNVDVLRHQGRNISSEGNDVTSDRGTEGRKAETKSGKETSSPGLRVVRVVKDTFEERVWVPVGGPPHVSDGRGGNATESCADDGEWETKELTKELTTGCLGVPRNVGYSDDKGRVGSHDSIPLRDDGKGVNDG